MVGMYRREVKRMLTFAIPCLFGLEGLVGSELRRLELRDVQVENGRVLCRGTAADLPRLNIHLRCGERVLLQLGSFPCTRGPPPCPGRSSSPGRAASR